VEPGAYDPETLNALRAVLDEAWSALTAEQQARTTKSEIAHRILRLAQRGERDPVRLRAVAILEVVPDNKRPDQMSAARTSPASERRVQRR
jgi:hypothetical protein